jgi:FkbM family methyltransferase
MKKFLRKYLPGPLAKLVGDKSSRTIKQRRLPAAQYDSLTALKCCVWHNRYGGYCVPDSSRHRSAPRRILRAEVFEPDTIEFMRNHCGAGDIVHAGTYFGDFLPGLAQACAPGAKIWAFEPNVENFRCAQITVLLNAIDNVTLRNAGLGEKEDTLRIRTRDESGTALGGKSWIVGRDEFDPSLDEEVQIVAIDSIVDDERKVSIIQLDVEGHEKAALAGALQTIHRCLPILIVEVSRGSDLLESEWFANNILNLGYKQTETVHNNTVFQV